MDEECASIERELRMAAYHNLELHSRWAASIDDVMRHLNELQPDVLHLAGHAISTGEHTELSDNLRLEDEYGRSRLVSASALSRMIASAAPEIRLVVLNACDTISVANSLQGVADCVVGMRGAMSGDSALSFSVGFYRALGYGRSVGNAVAQAVAILSAKEPMGWHQPVCLTKSGINANNVVLAGPLVEWRRPGCEGADAGF